MILKKHGLSNTRLHRIWSHMKNRCYNKNSEKYKNYGARGIKVCDEWLSDFVVFYNWVINNPIIETISHLIVLTLMMTIRLAIADGPLI